MVNQGNWNAIVGNSNDAVGKFALGKTNPRDPRLLEFAFKLGFTIINTFHLQKNSRKSKWHSPNGLVQNQIGYILMPQRSTSSFINLQPELSYPLAVINSDHDIVYVTWDWN